MPGVPEPWPSVREGCTVSITNAAAGLQSEAPVSQVLGGTQWICHQDPVTWPHSHSRFSVCSLTYSLLFHFLGATDTH